MNDLHNNNWLAERAGQAMVDGGFQPDVSRNAAEQAAEIERGTDQPVDTENTRDLRDLLWSSIDNETSRDLDQIEYAERRDDGAIRVLIGIADVDAYVPKDSAIDRRAAQNTVTVYTQGKIFPMLPEALSTGMTSLMPGQDRLAVVCDMAVTESGGVPESTFYRAVVRNKAKLAYETLGPWLDGDGPMPEQFAGSDELRGQILLQKEAAQRLRAYRMKKGALEFESIESEAVMENGEVRGLRSVRPNGARRLIENLMIAANVELAEFLESHGTASIRRVVRDPARWSGIVRVAAEYGVTLPPEPDQPALAAFLEQRRAADPEHFPDLSLSIVKLIGSGEYVVERPGEDSGGHFGLAVRDYAHSTAPNRRYADIVLQRLVKAVLDRRPSPYTPDELDAIALHCNEQEKAARKVERKMRKVVAAMVMRKHVGEKFDAIVTGITPSGTFARILRPPVDGRIEQGEFGLEVGEKVRVKLLSADPSTGFIDLAARRSR